MVARSGPPGPMAPHVTPLQANRPTCASDQTALRPVPQTAPVQMMHSAPAASQPVRTASLQIPQLSPSQQAFVEALERQRLGSTRVDSTRVKIKTEPVSSTKPVPSPSSVKRERSAATTTHDTGGYEPYTESARAGPAGPAEMAPVEEDVEPTLLLSEHADKMLSLAAEHEEELQAARQYMEQEMHAMAEENQRLRAALDASATHSATIPQCVASPSTWSSSQPSNDLLSVAKQQAAHARCVDAALKPLTESEAKGLVFNLDPKSVRLILPRLLSFLAVGGTQRVGSYDRHQLGRRVVFSSLACRRGVRASQQVAGVHAQAVVLSTLRQHGCVRVPRDFSKALKLVTCFGG